MLTKLHLSALTQSIKEILALGSITCVSFSSNANELIHPNEIWIDPGKPIGICGKDIDQDNDLDLFYIYTDVVSLIKNTGTPDSPEYTKPSPFISNPSQQKLVRLGLTDCLNDTSDQYVDIDADGDLDLFSASFNSKIVRDATLTFYRNDGTSEQPVYVQEDPGERFGLPESVSANKSSFTFKDIDNDGDPDFFSGKIFDVSPPVFYENIGSPENAMFQSPLQNPYQYTCNDEYGVGFLVDIDSDHQVETLCHQEDHSITALKQDAPGSAPQTIVPSSDTGENFSILQTLDTDHDGDIDIIADSGFNLYENTGNVDSPQFSNKGSLTTNILAVQSNLSGFFVDLDDDNDFDFITRKLKLFTNIGPDSNPDFEESEDFQGFAQCNNTLALNEASISDFTFIDIDTDNDLDLFMYTKTPGGVNELPVLKHYYCENQGSATEAVFSTAIENPFGLDGSRHFGSSANTIRFTDIEGDGDHDAFFGSFLYENIGLPSSPLFRETSAIPFPGEGGILIDSDHDGRADSAILTDGHDKKRFIKNYLQPASHIVATPLTIAGTKNLIIAVTRPDMTTLQSCQPASSECFQTVVHTSTAKEVSLSTGDFNGDVREDIILAYIDSNGQIKAEVYNDLLEQIGQAEGGQAHSVSVSSGQLDNDPADEYVVGFVQPDGHVAVYAVNIDGTVASHAIAEKGTKPSVDVGKIDDSGNQAIILTYLNSNHHLQTASYRSDGSLIASHQGEQASDVNVASMDIAPHIAGDEYITSLVQSDGKAALIGFSADGKQLGKVTGDISHHPKVSSGQFPQANSTGITASLILSDNKHKPAIYFLDNKGAYIASGVGSVNAKVSTHVVHDIDNDGVDEGILVYVDENGLPRWEIFNAKGEKQ